jgi:hypothetical protein
MITIDNERELVADETIKFFNDLTGKLMSGSEVDVQPAVAFRPRLSLVNTRLTQMMRISE